MGQPSDRAPRPGTRRWPALAVGLVAAFMTLLDVSIVNVAVPSIQRALDAGPSALQWVLSGYALAFGLVLVPAGRYGDARGRRGIFVLGAALFTASSAAAGLARSTEWLIVARLLQGAAAGLVNPQVTGLIQQLFPAPERGRPFGMLGTTIGVSTAVGPLLGGLLIEVAGTAHGWRWVFFVNIPVGVVTIVFAWRLLPSRGWSERKGIDALGVTLLGVGLLGILFPLVQHDQWRGPAKWLLIPAGLAVLGAFVGWEHRYGRRGAPVFDLGLFRLRSYTLGALIALIYFAGFTAIFFVFTIYLQNGLGHTALAAGLTLTPFALGAAVASAVGGRVVNRLGRPLIATGLALVALGLGAVVVVLEVVPGRDVPLTIAAPLAVAGIGSGLVITPNQTLALADVPIAQAGSAAGMLQTGQRVGAAAGIAGIGAVFFAALAHPGTGYAAALRMALLVTVGFVVAALVTALVDIRLQRRP